MKEVEEYLDLYFYRPVAFIIVKSVYNTGITPDHLTLAAIFCGLTGSIFYTLGPGNAAFIGALFFALFIIFDCSDGQLARLKKNGTPLGRILDGAADYLVSISVYIGIAFGYSNEEGEPSMMLLLLIISGLSVMVQHMLVDFYRTRFLTVVSKRKNILKEDLKEYRIEYIRLKTTKGKAFERNVIYLYLIYLKLQRKLIARRTKDEFTDISAEDYYNKNRVLLRLWLTMGPSAMRTTLIVCSVLNRFDIFFWIIIAGFNILAATLWIIQRQFDRSLLTQTR